MKNSAEPEEDVDFPWGVSATVHRYPSPLIYSINYNNRTIRFNLFEEVI